jgi:SAM-dependent methyltransferase
VDPTGFSSERVEHLGGIEGSHFWFGPRDRLLAAHLDAIRRPGDQHLVELGCGTGRMLPSWTARGLHVTGVEAYASMLGKARRRDELPTLVCANVEALPLATGQFDLIGAFDVLEHVDPTRFLDEARRIAAPGGRLLLSVPSSPALWSTMDVRAGHRCRYTRSMLDTELVRAGFRLMGTTSYQFLLYPAVFIARRLLGGPEKLERRPSRVASRLFGRINDFEVRRLGGRSLPWGSSLIAWAEAA